MPQVELKVQLFNALLGTQEGIHSVILPDIYSSGGSYNLWIDKYGRARKIDGFAKANASPVVSNIGAAATGVKSLFPYRKIDAGVTSRQLVGVFESASEWEVWTSADSGSNWTFQYDAGATAVGQIADFAQFGSQLFIANGKVAPRVWDGSTIDAAGQLQSPQPSTSEGDPGNLTGSYAYKLISVLNTDVRKAGSKASTTLDVEGTKIDLSWTADPDTDVIGYEVYRTTGSGETYYLLTYLKDRTTSALTDNTSDTELLNGRALEEHGDAPPTTYFCEPHQQRVWWLNSDTYPTRAWWSDPGRPDSVYAFNFLEFSDSDTQGDVITGASGNFEGRMIVFTERAVWTVAGTGAVVGGVLDWTRTRTNAQVGSVSHRSAVRIPAGAKYANPQGEVISTGDSAIAYFTPLGDIRVFDGDNDTIISTPVKDSLATFNYAERRKVFAVNDAERQQVMWFYPSSADTEDPDKIVVWNYRWGVWYVWEAPALSNFFFASGCAAETDTESQVLFVGQAKPDNGGYVYRFFEGDSFDGSRFTAAWMTKQLFGTDTDGFAQVQAYSNRKRWRWIDVLFQANQDVELTVEWLNGNAPDNASGVGNVTIQPGGQAIITSQGSTILTADSSSILAALASAHIKKLLKGNSGDYLHDEGIRIRVSDTTSSPFGSWALEAFALAYQILPGQKRRSQY